LQRKLAESAEVEEPEPARGRVSFGSPVSFTPARNVEPPRTRQRSSSGSRRQPKGTIEQVLDSRVGREVAGQVMRGIFGLLKGR